MCYHFLKYFVSLLTPCTNECTFNFLDSKTFEFEHGYTKRHQHVCHQITNIKLMVKHIFIDDLVAH
jgi:hypothetical protein